MNTIEEIYKRKGLEYKPFQPSTIPISKPISPISPGITEIYARKRKRELGGMIGEAEKSYEDAMKASSLWGMTKETFKGIPGAISPTFQKLFTPKGVEYAGRGLIKGVSLGYLAPETPEEADEIERAIEAGFEMAGFLVPFVGMQHAVGFGLKVSGAAAKLGKFAPAVVTISSWLTPSQLHKEMKGATWEMRAKQAALDMAVLAAFWGLGKGVSFAKGKVFPAKASQKGIEFLVRDMPKQLTLYSPEGASIVKGLNLTKAKSISEAMKMIEKALPPAILNKPGVQSTLTNFAGTAMIVEKEMAVSLAKTTISPMTRLKAKFFPKISPKVKPRIKPEFKIKPETELKTLKRIEKEMPGVPSVRARIAELEGLRIKPEVKITPVKVKPKVEIPKGKLPEIKIKKIAPEFKAISKLGRADIELGKTLEKAERLSIYTDKAGVKRIDGIKKVRLEKELLKKANKGLKIAQNEFYLSLKPKHKIGDVVDYQPKMRPEEIKVFGYKKYPIEKIKITGAEFDMLKSADQMRRTGFPASFKFQNLVGKNIKTGEGVRLYKSNIVNRELLGDTIKIQPEEVLKKFIARQKAPKIMEAKVKARPAGEVAEEMVGGGPRLIERDAIKRLRVEKLLERFFPYLKKKALSKEFYGRLTVEQEKDLMGLGGWVRSWLMPARAFASKHPIAQLVTKSGRDTQLMFELDREGINEIIRDIYKPFKPNFLKKFFQKYPLKKQEEFVRWQESGKPLEEIPIEFRRAVKIKRKLNQDALEMMKKDFKIDTSKFRFTPENYFYHLFIGKYQIKTGAKFEKTVGFARNLNEAYDKARVHLTLHPEANVKIAPKEIFQDPFTATMLGRKGFWRFIDQVGKSTELSKEEILGIMKGVAAVKPRPKFVGSLLPRKANLAGYEKSPEFVETIYWNRLLKKKYMEPWRKKMMSKVAEAPPNLKKELEEYINEVSGKYYSYGVHWMPKITRIQSMLKLGYRPSSALMNRLQPLTTTYPEIGEKYFAKTFAYKRTRFGKILIEQSGVLRQPPKYYAGEYLKGGPEAKYHPLYLFSSAELANRSDTYIAGYLFAKDKLNLSLINSALKKSKLPQFKNQKVLAKSFATDLVTSTQFIYDITDLPKMMRSPIGRLIFQFRPFTINYMYNVTRILRGKPLAGLEIYYPEGLTRSQAAFRAGRFLGVNIATGGFVRSVPLPVRIGLITWLLAQLNEEQKPKVFSWYLKLNFGLFGLLGVDLATQIGIQPYEMLPIPTRINWGDFDALTIPQTALEMLGVTGSDMALIIEVLKRKQPELLLSSSPMAYKMYQALRAEDGYVLSPYQRERLITELTLQERAVLALGFTPVKMAEKREFMAYERKQVAVHKEKRAKYVDKILDALTKGDKAKAIEIIKEGENEKPYPIIISSSTLLDAAEARKIEAPIRMILGMPKIMRKEAAEIYKEIR